MVRTTVCLLECISKSGVYHVKHLNEKKKYHGVMVKTDRDMVSVKLKFSFFSNCLRFSHFFTKCIYDKYNVGNISSRSVR